MFIKTIDYDNPTLARPISQACTEAQFDESVYAYWCEQIKEPPRKHRKQWEFCYIAQVLAASGMLAPGRTGLGFGVGTEPLAALFASRGASVLATDLEADDAARIGWAETNQHAHNKSILNERGICSNDLFEKNVAFRFLDMNAIPESLGTFDFTWSACAFEHLGSIRHGHDFIMNAAKILKPGGIAVHTTELNCSSNDKTLDEGGTVLFRKHDFEQMAYDLDKVGCDVDLNFHLGSQAIDRFVDVPPYSSDNHLKLQLEQWVTTSFGLVARKR